MSAPGPTGERQEDLDAIISFLRNTQLMFLKQEKDPTSKQFDDDEWIRASLAIF